MRTFQVRLIIGLAPASILLAACTRGEATPSPGGDGGSGTTPSPGSGSGSSIPFFAASSENGFNQAVYEGSTLTGSSRV